MVLFVQGGNLKPIHFLHLIVKKKAAHDYAKINIFP